MGSSITFSPTRPLRGWGLDAFDVWEQGQLVKVVVQLEAQLPGGRRSGLFVLKPETPGFDVMERASFGGADALHEAAVFLVEATREALKQRTDLTAEQRAYWQPVVDEADHARAVHAARYPDGRVPAFEVVGALLVTV